MTTNFHEKEASEYLKPEEFARYGEQQGYYFEKLSYLHQNVYFVRQIVDFPLALFQKREDLFLIQMVFNTLQVIILEITKLTTDKGHDVRTILEFKNFMARAVKDEYQKDYRDLLRKMRFTAAITDLISRAKKLRDS